MSYQTTVLADAPLRYYRLGESSGTTATDLGSQGQNGTLSGGITLGQSGLLVGDADTAYLLNGSTGMLSIPTTGLPTGAASWSVECWVQFSAAPSTWTGLISLGTQLTGKELELAFDGSGLPYVGLKNIQGPTDPSPLATDTPHHLVGTYDGTTLHLYVDGTEVGTPLATTPNITYGGAVIGEYYLVGAFFAGIMDEVAIYGTALSASRVLAHYNAAGYQVQTDFYVSPSGSDSNPGTQARPWQTLHKALTTIGAGDTALFADGIYQVQSGGEFTSCVGTLQASNRWGAKITQQAGATTGSQMLTFYNDGWTLDGFEITGPDASIAIAPHSGVYTIKNCWIHDVSTNTANTGTVGGGVVFAEAPSVTLAGPVEIIANRFERIGPMIAGVIQQDNLIHGVYQGNPITVQGRIENNLCIQICGDGVSLYHNPQNWLVTNNTAIKCLTAGVECWGDPAVPYLADHNIIQNNIFMHCGDQDTTFANNKAVYSPSANCGTHNVFRTNLAFGNYTTAYQIGTQAATNLTNADPLFINYQADGTGDYHLAARSVCIDAGTSTGAPATDYDGTARPQGRAYDIGAYESFPPDQALSITIGTTSVLVNGLTVEETADGRTVATLTIYDAAGAFAFQPRQPVSIVDTTNNYSYSGYVNDSQKTPGANGVALTHTVTCVDKTDIPMKRYYAGPEWTNRQAGDIVTDLTTNVLAAEGITINAAMDEDKSVSDWQAGTQNNTAAVTTSTGGALQLALAGSAVTKAEANGTDWGTGTRTNLHISGSTLTLKNYSAIMLQGQCIGYEGVGGAYANLGLWGGSYVIATGDTLKYTIWISSTSPSITASIDGICNADGTTIGNYAPSFSHQVRDQNGLWASPQQDLTGYANDQWYTRTIDIGTLMHGQTLNSIYMQLSAAGNSKGQYNVYVHDISIVNGATTKLTVAPANTSGLRFILASALSQRGFLNLQATQLTAYEPTGTRLSNGTDLTAVGCFGPSLLTYQATLPTSTLSGASCNVAIYTSTDNATWQLAPSAAAIPSLIVGAASAGVSLYFKEVLTIVGPDPTISPILTNVTATIQPTYTNVNTDFIKTVSTQAGWNGGTLTGLTAQSDNSLTLQKATTNNWDGNTGTPNQTLFTDSGGSQSTVNRDLALAATNTHDARARFDFAGTFTQFDMSINVQVPPAGANIGLEWATTNYANGLNSYAYVAYITTTQIKFSKGTNGTAGSEVNIANAAFGTALTAGDWHTLRVQWGQSANAIVVYLDGAQFLSTTDATYPSGGALSYVGVRFYNNSGLSPAPLGYFSNFAIVQTLSSNLYTSQNLTGFGNVGSVQDSRLFWQSNEPSGSGIVAQVSINGGAYANATNGATIPGLTQGMSVTGQHLNVKFTFNTTDPTLQPVLYGYTAWVSSAYNASGSRISPTLSLTPVVTVGSTSATWLGSQPTGTGILVDTSTDGSNFFNIGSGASGSGQIPGLFTPTDPVVDEFSTDTSNNYISTCRTGGSIATWTWDTTNRRIVASGGVNAHLLYASPMIGADVDVSFVMDQSDNGGFIWRWVDQGNHYALAIHDASSPNNPNVMELFSVTGGGGGTITPLTLYNNQTTSSTVGTMKQASETLGTGSFTTKQTTIGTANAFGEIFAFGTAGAWAGTSGLIDPSVNNAGFLDDGIALEGNSLIAGIWTPSIRLQLNVTATITADIYCRVFKRSSGGTITSIGDCLFSAQTITAALVTYTFPGTTLLGSPTFATGDKVGYTWQMNITSNTNGLSTLAIKMGMSSVANTGVSSSKLVTPGFQTGSGGATNLLSSVPISFVRGTPHAFRVRMIGPNIDIDMDGLDIIDTGDTSITQAGFAGLRNDNSGGASSANFYLFRLQYYGQDVTSSIVLSRVRLNSTDPTQTPIVNQLALSVHDPNIQNGALIPQTKYSVLNNNRIDLAAIFDNLAQQSENFWWKMVNFSPVFQAHQATPAPWVLTPQGLTGYDMMDSPAPVLDTINDTYRNSQWGTGGTDVIPITPQEFIGNGTQTAFDCGFPIDSVTGITLNEAVQTFGITNSSTGVQWYYTQGQSTIVQDTSGTPLSASQTLVVAFNAQVGVTVNIQSPSEIARIQAIEGEVGNPTTGIIDYGEDMSGLDKLAIIAKCAAELNQWGQENETLTFSTQRNGLAVGQLQAVFASPLGVFAKAFLLLHLKMAWNTRSTGGGAAEPRIQYDATGVTGGQVLSWTRFIHSLGGGR